MRQVVLLVLAAGCASGSEATSGPDTVAARTTTVRIHQPSAPPDAAKHEADCTAGNAVACHAAALDHYYARSPENDTAALERFRKACAAGYAPSCNGVGAMYADGRGVAKDEVEAVRWFRASCAKDASTGCEHLAQAFDTGHGVGKDPDAARVAHARGECLFERSLGHDAGVCPDLTPNPSP